MSRQLGRGRAAPKLPLVLMALVSVTLSWADGPSAIQERKLRMQHEINLSLGVLPADAYTKGFTGQLGYTLHFSDVWAWQIVRGGYSLQSRSSLRTQLERDYGRLPTEFDAVQYFAGTALYFKPFYGKLSAFNRSVVSGELYFFGGASLMRFNFAFRPGVDVGVGVRVYLNRVFSLRFDFSDTVALPFAGAEGLVNILSANAGISLNLGGTE
jgi:outer membrane beta-barrel protein